MSEILTAETDRGLAALDEISNRSRKKINLSGLPGEWVRILMQGDKPVAYAAVDPDREIAYPKGSVRYAYLKTLSRVPGSPAREAFLVDLLENLVGDLRSAGMPWIIGRLPFGLGQDLGFAAFTHYSCFILRPEEIEQTLGGRRAPNAADKITIQHDSDYQDDLLLVTDVRAETQEDCIDVLREAAWVARSNGKARILFEQPPVGLPGSDYAIHDTRQSILLDISMACHARVRVEASDAEMETDELGHTIPTDMVRILSLPSLVGLVAEAADGDLADSPNGSVAFDIPAGQATITTAEGRCEVVDEVAYGAELASFSAPAVAQILTGFRSATTQAYLDEVTIERDARRLLDRLFPRFWRFSRNEKWLLREWAKK